MRHGAILRTFENRPIAEIYLQLLQEAGLPVRLEVPLTGLTAYNPGAADIYIDDEKLLDDPEVQRTIEAVFAPVPEDTGEE
jgi:hypothetical protein